MSEASVSTLENDSGSSVDLTDRDNSSFNDLFDSAISSDGKRLITNRWLNLIEIMRYPL